MHLLVAAATGVVAVSARGKTRILATVIYVLFLSFFVFGRTRSSALLVLGVPLLYWFFTSPRRVSNKLILGIVLGGALVGWLGVMQSARASSGTVARFLGSGGSIQEFRYEGLNMFEELNYVNKFLINRTLETDLGSGYLGHFLNFVPRALWPNKPLVGFDYAVARGQGRLLSQGGGVNATISTGFIGQGVLSFGATLGPIFVAVLMALWCSILGRLRRLAVYRRSYAIPYVVGVISTVGLGRDVTLLVLYPFIFSWIMAKYLERPAARVRYGRGYG